MGAGGAADNQGDRDTYNPLTGKTTEKKKSFVDKFREGERNKKRKKQANVEVGLGKDRMSNYSIDQGGTGPGRDDDGSNRNQNEPLQATIMPMPTDAPNKSLDTEISEEDKKYDARKTKKKGRRRTLLTSSKGVTTTSSDYSLGKPTLLGMV